MNDALTCECGSVGLEITAQSDDNDHAFEGYKWETSGAIGTLTDDNITGTTLTGCVFDNV